MASILPDLPPDVSTPETTHGHILVIDDEPDIRESLEVLLTSEGYRVELAGNATEGLKRLESSTFDLVLLDLMMPDKSGMEVLEEIRVRDRETPIFLITAYGSVEVAVTALKRGANDYFSKPWDNEKLLIEIDRMISKRRLERENTELKRALRQRYSFPNIVGKSERMLKILDLVGQVAASRATILITGETGTGKELIARAIHDRSAQRDMPLIKVNCAAIPETLLESELFGHVRGAFTGATMTKRGKFALADGGSIFLDEIGTMSATIQSKLLRVLQEREFEPLGAERTQKVEVRVIAATNRDLKQMVADGKFQEDLYYRLNVIPIVLPPLRERPDDIPVLIDHFIEKHRQRTGKRIERVEPDVIDALRAYNWPGNVRELENTIERAVVLATGPVITASSISLLGATSTPSSGLPSPRLHQNIEWVERETIRRALQQAGGVKKDAAELMGISQRALSYYLAKYRID